MAHLYKPQYTKTNKQTGEKIKKKTRKWYGKYRDSTGIVHQKPLCTDKAASQAMLNDLIKQTEREIAGLSDPAEKYRKLSVEKLLQHFVVGST